MTTHEQRITGFVVVTAMIGCVLAVETITSPSVLPFQNVAGHLLEATTMSRMAIGGIAIGAISIYLSRRDNVQGTPPDQDGESSLPRPSANRKPDPSVPRTTAVEPLESTCHTVRDQPGSSDRSGDTASEDDGTDCDATTESESDGGASSGLVNPLNVDSTEDGRPEEAPTQHENDEEESEGSNAHLAEAHVNTDEHQFDWVAETGVKMADVGGMNDVKAELWQDIIQPMRDHPEKAERFDIPLPNVLLHGPPGTGKTYLAKALATELGFPFVSLSGSDVTSKWVNESADQVGQLFDEAEDLAEETGGAVIFLDELDSVLPERELDSHGEDRKVVNEFLSHLQESARKRVLFIGATNRRDDLDDAATRNGRIDKQAYIGEPDYDARVEIFRAQLAGRPHSLSESELEDLAAATEGVVAADIESMVNKAARNAAYGRNGDQIELQDLKRQLN